MIERNRTLILIVGAYGAGKTTYLRALSGCLRLDYDEILDTLHGPPRKYYNECRAVTQAMLDAGLERALATGASIVLPVTAPRRADRARYVRRAQAAGYRVRIVYLDVSYDEALRRCKADPARPKTTRWHELLATWFRDFEPVLPEKADEVIYA